MEGVAAASAVEQSLLVSTMVHYGRKLKRERKNRVTRKLAELGVKVSAGLSAPYVISFALTKQVLRKADSLLITGAYVPPLLTLAENSSPEERSAYEAFQSKVVKSPLFWVVAGLSLAVVSYILFVTYGASAKIQQSLSLAISASGSAGAQQAVVESAQAIGVPAMALNYLNLFAGIRALTHIARHGSEVKKIQKKRRDLRYLTA